VENVGNVVETAAENEVVLLHNTHQESTMTALIEVMVATVVTAVAATILGKSGSCSIYLHTS
jgi:hypothetical protein